MYNKVIMFKVKYEILKAGKVVAKFGNFKTTFTHLLSFSYPSKNKSSPTLFI